MKREYWQDSFTENVNVRWQPVAVSKDSRARAKRQKPLCIWFTGLSGAGKSSMPICWRSGFITSTGIPICLMATTCGADLMLI